MDNPPPAPPHRPAVWHVFLAPIIYLFAPARAAAVMIAASAWAFWLMFAVYALFSAGSVVLCVIWDDMLRWDYYGGTYSTWPPPVRFRSLSEVWDEWHPNGRFGGLERTFLSILTALLGLSALLAWMNVPRVHRDGRFWASFSQAHRIVSSAAGAVALRISAAAVTFAAVDRAQYLGWWQSFDPAYVLVPAFGMATILLLRWIGLAVGARPRLPLLATLPPHCEGCGYDLTARALEERCPECGRLGADSLTPGRRRQESKFERSPNPATWLETTLDVLFTPARFYAGLQVDGDGRRADTFARSHIGLTGIIASSWCIVCYLQSEAFPKAKELFAAATMSCVITVVVVWVVHRMIAAVAATAVLFTRALPDHIRLARAIAYETAYAWVPCICNGVFVTTFLGNWHWVSDMVGDIGFRRTFGMPAEPLLVFAVNLALIGAWLLRYRTIVAAIRWSNY